MRTIEYTTIDRTDWDPTIGVGECDKKQWLDETTGYPCMILRNRLGAWCGYVGVRGDHPSYARHYDDVPDVTVHGGLTYAGYPYAGDITKTIRHEPDPGEPDDIWWLGFDCCHAYDRYPMRHPGLDYSFSDRCVYRTQEYAEQQCRELALQLKAQETIRDYNG